MQMGKLGKSIKCKGEEKMDKKEPAKRINVVSIKMVKESSILYDIRRIEAPKDAVELGKRISRRIRQRATSSMLLRLKESANCTKCSINRKTKIHQLYIQGKCSSLQF